MKRLANKAQKTFEASIRMLMIKEGMKFEDAQNAVLEVVEDFKTDKVTNNTLKEMIACLEVTFLGKKVEDMVSDLLK